MRDLGLGEQCLRNLCVGLGSRRPVSDRSV